MNLETGTGNYFANGLLVHNCHRLCAPTFSYYLAHYRRARRFGFTATPEGRFDGADAKMEAVFGPRLYFMSYQEAQQLGMVLPIRVEWLPIHMDNPAPDAKGVIKDRLGIWRNHVRHAVIAERLRQVPPDEQVLILVETIEHGAYLKHHLPDYRLVYSNCNPTDYQNYLRMGYLNEHDDPYVTDYHRAQYREAFEDRRLLRAIATNWDTGVDFTGLQVLVAAQGKASKIMAYQGPGRVSRLCQAIGKEKGLVIDCVDYFDKTLLERGRNRWRHYDEHGWEQVILGGELLPKRRKAAANGT